MKLMSLNNATGNYRNRPGVTLVELLMVMAVILLLAGITLPSFRSMLQGQKVSQATRQVQGMIEAARARALAQGRPVAVVFDRIAVDPTSAATFNHVSDNTATRLSMGEVFPPYEGDWAGATGDLIDTNSDGIPDTLQINVAKVASLFDVATSTPSGLVQAGDLLQLGDHSQTFSITGLSMTGSIVNIAFMNPPVNYSTTDALWLVGTTDIRFRMIRRPTKSLAGSTVLPRGICVDLSQSGIGQGGNDFWVAPRSGMTLPDLYGPLFIVFNARGNVEGAYYISRPSATVYTPVVVTTPGVYHLLVGRTDQVEPTGLVFGADRDDFKPNLYDPNNFWISINPYSGAIYSTPNAAVTPSGTPAIDRSNARVFATNVLNARGT